METEDVPKEFPDGLNIMVTGSSQGWIYLDPANLPLNWLDMNVEEQEEWVRIYLHEGELKVDWTTHTDIKLSYWEEHK